MTERVEWRGPELNQLRSHVLKCTKPSAIAHQLAQPGREFASRRPTTEGSRDTPELL